MAARDPRPSKRVRVGGSGSTTFWWTDDSGTHLIGYAENVTVNYPQPVAQPVAIQPLNAQRPIEIITPAAHTNGTITLTLTELYNETVWNRLSTLANSQDIVDIMRTVAAMQNGIQVIKRVKPLHTRQGGSVNTVYQETFHNVVVASVEDQGETIDITTMNLPKSITLWYTHSIKGYVNKGNYQWPRDVRTEARLTR